MKKTFIKWEKIAITASLAGVLILFYIFKIPCVFFEVVGFPCVACGMTRAWLAFFSLDIVEAFKYHSLFWTLPILYVYFWRDGLVFKKRFVNLGIFWGIVSLFLIRWIIIVIREIAAAAFILFIASLAPS